MTFKLKRLIVVSRGFLLASILTRSAILKTFVVVAAMCGLVNVPAAPALSATPRFGASTAVAVTDPSFAPIPGTRRTTTDVTVGGYKNANMSVEVVLAPRHQSLLADLLKETSLPGSSRYAHWLRKGQFDALFAPDTTHVAAMSEYLRAAGLNVERSSSPFLLRASGSSDRVSSAFRTSLSVYRNPRGIAYFSNDSAVQLPTSLAASALGVVGLSNTVRLHSHPAYSKTAPVAKADCETPYPTLPQLLAYLQGTPFAFGYGGGPGCSGLTPSQTNFLYGAPHIGSETKGAGVDLAVYEFSGYRQSDIATWAHTFYGRTYTPRIENIVVDGGPVHPHCPSGDPCPPSVNGYRGDVEVALDVELDLAIAPRAHRILVYNGPVDETGETVLDEYARVASDDVADVASSSWYQCESDAGTSMAQAENVIFEQMALQGQSTFAITGDTGAFACIYSSGKTVINAADPGAQPWVTSVGGTSFQSYNPGRNPHPKYPEGIEAVWNIFNLCNASPSEYGYSGLFWCTGGASGGGNSQYWGRPFYQFGPGVLNRYTTFGNGTTQCSLAPIGTPCREIPDVSADADSYTPYAEYCTGDVHTNSECADYPAWAGGSGTSASSPLWSAIIADRDSFLHSRSGNVNPLLYLLFNLDASGYFHDVTGIHQPTNNNGLFPTTKGYDQTTGIGTPRMAPLITGFPATW
jgi:kumamolisin